MRAWFPNVVTRRFSPEKAAILLVWSYEIAGSHDSQYQSYSLAVMSFEFYRKPRELIATIIPIHESLSLPNMISISNAIMSLMLNFEMSWPPKDWGV